MNDINDTYKKKAKRGSNYTPLEKELLFDIVKGYLSIIENKSTTGELIRKKQHAWQQVTKQFNSVATSGHRTWHQLRHLYENIKQKFKRNVFTINNQQQYQKALKIKPEGPLQLENDDIKLIENMDDMQSMQTMEPMIDITENVDEITENVDETTENVDELTYSRPLCNKERARTKHKKANEMMNIKEQYFKVKLGNAKLERKYLVQRHKLEIHLLKLKIEKLTSSPR